MNPDARLWRQFLSGIWREPLPSLELDAAQWERLAPALLGTRAAALTWRRLKNSPLSAHPLAQPFREQYRPEWLCARLVAEQLEHLIQILRARDIEAVPVKGWLCARHYADVGLRPAGDIDLCVRSADFAAAVECLQKDGAQNALDENFNRVQNRRLREEKLRFPDAPPGWCLVELHEELTDLHACGEPRWDALLKRGQTLTIGATPARVLAPEDHLRLMAIHFLRHEAARPLWLCDLSAALEARHENWDWPHCLGRDQTRANWVKTALLLARELTGVSLAGAPFESQSLPRWMVPHIVRIWNMGQAPVGDDNSDVMWNYLRAPLRMWRQRKTFGRELARRWPTPIFAAVSCHCKLDNAPHLSWQLRYCARLGGGFLAHLPHFVRRERGR